VLPGDLGTAIEQFSAPANITRVRRSEKFGDRPKSAAADSSSLATSYLFANATTEEATNGRTDERQ